MRFEHLIKELRLMKSQPGNRFYAVVCLIALHLLLTPLAAVTVVVRLWVTR